MLVWKSPITAALCVVIATALLQSAAADSAAKQGMHAAYRSLSLLLGRAIDVDGATQESVEFDRALEQLEQASIAISEHTTGRPYSFDPLTRSLERNVKHVTNNYRAGFIELGDLYLIETIDHCAACHSRSPEAISALPADKFVQNINRSNFDTAIATRLLVAVRKFAEAKELWLDEFDRD